MNMLEIWKYHPVYTNYKGSNFGNICNIKKNKNLNGTIRCSTKVFNNGYSISSVSIKE